MKMALTVPDSGTISAIGKLISDYYRSGVLPAR
jgi:hypothetical protein